MATSNSFDFSMTANDVLNEAFEQIGVLADGQAVTPGDQASCLRTFNMMVKQWSGNFDFAPGLKAYARKHGCIFLQTAQSIYSLGPSGDNATLSYVHTTLSASAAASATSLYLTSVAGISANDKIGIRLNDGSIHWTTISGTPGSPTTIATGLASAASAGNAVFAYTTKLIRPLYIENMVLRDILGNDIPVYPMTFRQYENLPVKYADGMPTEYYYSNTLINGTLAFDIEPSDTSYVSLITFMAPAEDYDLITNDIAFPQEWYMALALGLSKLIASKFGVAWTDLMESNLNAALMMARTSYAETTEEYFQPGVD